jgi:SMC interacting uncharacterized protein involved in chromosome segregation
MMDMERVIKPLQRELDQLRSQTFASGQHSNAFRRMEEERRELKHELEILQKKYDGVTDGFMVNEISYCE